MNKVMDLQGFDDYVQQGKTTWWNMEIPSGNVSFGKAKSDMLGRKPEEFSHYKDFTDLLHSDDYQLAMTAMQDHLDGNKDYYETVYRIKHKNGHYLNFYDFGMITDKKDHSVTVVGYVLKLENAEDVEKMSEFRDLIISGNPVVTDLIKRIKSVQK